MKQKLLIHCPANSTTGGPEALHQFCSVAKNFIDTKICYYLDNSAKVPSKFSNYAVSKSDFFDDENTFHLIPEISTKYFTNKIKNGKIIIFWLSVDNFLNLKDRSKLRNFIYYFSSLITHRRPMIFLKKYLHLSQSEYSNSFLRKNNFKFSFIGDYIRQECYDLNTTVDKKNYILYNPKKGINKLLPVASELKNKYQLIPLENLSSIKLKDMLQISKIYIDFGRLPGKDRIPREAILNNCCILIGKRGAGVNDEDFSISDKFKINVDNSNYISHTKNLIIDIMENYELNIKEFENYKKKILDEKNIFEKNIKNFINSKIIFKK
jgi:hypothetical protein